MAGFFVSSIDLNEVRMGYLIVFIGAGIGGALRHGVNQAAFHLLGSRYPFGTLTVNVVGSLVMGILAGYFAFKGDAPQHWRLFLTAGILGGFTTFSAFSLDVILLYERGEGATAAGYVLLSVSLSLAALLTGLAVTRSLL
jgi:fluoride exporter